MLGKKIMPIDGTVAKSISAHSAKNIAVNKLIDLTLLNQVEIVAAADIAPYF